MPRDPAPSRLVTRRGFLGGGAAAGGLFATYVTVLERLRFEVNHYRVPIRDLPRSLDGARILQISDIHYGPLMDRGIVEKVLDRAAAVPCEAIALTGDYVHGDDSRHALEWVIPRLGSLRAPLGVFAVLGNHDHYAGAARARELLEDHGLSLVHAEHAIERDDGRLWIAGTGDLWEDHMSIDRVLRDVPDAEPRIMLAHNPDTADREWKARVDLMLSGHTHGGQIDLPLFGPPVLPVENRRYARGLVDTPRTRLFVSKGIGWTTAPVRFRCAPELAVLVLSREPVPGV